MAPSVELATGYISLAVSTRGMGRQVIGAFSGVERAAADAGRRSGNRFTSGMSSGLKEAKGLIMGATRAAAGIGGALLAAGGAVVLFGIKTAASMEQAKIGFTTMLGSGEKANKFLKQLADFAAKTPFEFPELQKAASSLIAAGINADKVIPIMRTLGDVTSGVGTGAEGVQRATIAIQQMNAAGKITAEDLNQLRDAGIPVYELLAKATGKSQVEVAKLASSGKLGRKELEQLMKALESGKGLERFTGLMKKQSASLNGMLSTFKDTLGQGLAKALKPALPIIKDWIGKATELADKALPAVQDFLKKIAKDKELKKSIDNLKTALKGVTDLDFKKALDDVANALPGIVQGLADVITKFNEFDAWTKEHGGDKKGGDQFSGLGGVFYNSGLAANHWIKKMWVDMKTSFIEGHTEVLGDVTGFAGGVISRIKGLAGRFTRSASSMWADVKTSFVTGHKEVIGDVVGFRDSAVSTFRTLAGRLKRSTTSMLASIGVSYKKGTGEIAAKVSGWKTSVISRFSELGSRVKGSTTATLSSIGASWKRGTGQIATTVGGWRDRLVRTARDLSSKIRTAISDMLTKLKDRFGTGVTAIGKVWDGIKDKAKAPVKFVVETVIDNGLLAAVRAVSKLVGFKDGENAHVSLPKGWASGTSQVLPGYTPGRDVHRFYSATGGVLDLSGGEGIARPELVRMVGKRRWDELNLAAAHGRLTERYLGAFAQGTGFLGGLRPVPAGSTHRHSGYSWARWAGDLGASMNTPVHAWKSGVIAAVRYLTTSYGRHIIENVQGSRVYYAHLARAVVRAGQNVSQGQVIGYSDSTGNSTGPHLHFEIRGGTAGISGGGPGGGILGPVIDVAKYTKMVTDAIAKLKSIKDSPFGQMAAGAAETLAGKVKDKISSLVAKFATKAVGALAGLAGFSGASGSNRSLGHRMLLAAGWGESQWPPLNALWTRESGWRTTARNPSSGAYGIPQSLPASKMASAGSDWRTNPATQIKWGLGYIRGRYGSPSGAWAHSRATGWYANGTLSAPPGWAVVGERGPELLRFSGGEQVVPNEHLRTTAGSPLIGSVHWHSEGTVRDDMEELGFQLRRINRGGVYARG